MTGIICVNKPSGLTSFDVCYKIRRIFNEKKVGHTGTLDPMAEGVLVVMLGGATKFLDYMPESEKVYEADFVLGQDSESYDTCSEVIGEIREDISLEKLEEVLDDFRGDILQEPPMFSAKQVNGKRLYQLAREGIEIEREKCPVTIEKLEVSSFDKGLGKFVISCSKGTYIRSLIHDIGIALDTSAIMSSLKRVKTSGFSIESSHTIEELENMSEEELKQSVISVEKAFDYLENIKVSPAQSTRFANGGALDKERLRQEVHENQMYRVYSFDGVFLGLGKGSENQLKCERLLTKRD